MLSVVVASDRRYVGPEREAATHASGCTRDKGIMVCLPFRVKALSGTMAFLDALLPVVYKRRSLYARLIREAVGKKNFP